MLIITWRKDLSVQDSAAALKLHRSFKSRQIKFFGAALQISLSARQFPSLCADDQPQTTGSMVAKERSAEAGRLRQGMYHVTPVAYLTHFLRKVCENKKWSDIGRLLGYTGVPGLSTQIKQSYARVILPYEDFCRRSRNVAPTVPPSRSTPSKSVPPLQTPAPTPISALPTQVATATTSKLSHENVASISRIDQVSTSPLSSPSSTLSELPDEEESKQEEPKSNCKSRSMIVH